MVWACEAVFIPTPASPTSLIRATAEWMVVVFPSARTLVDPYPGSIAIVLMFILFLLMIFEIFGLFMVCAGFTRFVGFVGSRANPALSR